MAHIKFGTDGWRGVIAEDFTFAGVQKVSLATGRYFAKHKLAKNGIVIGYDARFLSKEFAQCAAQVIASIGVKVLLSEKISPTQMVSLGVVKKKAAGGIVITASHNPAKYNGFKIKGDFGGPAHPEMVTEVEKELAPLQDVVELPIELKPFDELVKNKTIQYIDLTKIYVADIETKIEFDLIKSVKLKIMHDAMFGAGMGIPELFLPKMGTIRSEYNPSFGTTNPEPLPQNVEELSMEVRSGKYHFGFATDGDADRIGAVDEKGNFVDSHRIFAILLKYLIERKHYRGAVAKSLSVSDIIVKMCDHYNVRLYETPVGFKYLCRMMTEKDIIIAGEESGGIAVKGHLPERDGIFIGFLLAEVMAVRRMKLSQLVKELFDEFGEHHFGRIDAHLTNQQKEKVMKFYLSKPKKFGSFKTIKFDMTDGVKTYTKDGWILVRASGTEPLIRFYAEARSPKIVRQMLKAATSVK